MSKQNCDLACRWFEEVWNQRRHDTIHEILDDDSVCFTDDGPMRGAAEFIDRMFAPFLAAFPDLKVHVDGVLADRDEVAIRWTGTGTHTGPGLGFPPTNQPIEVCGISWIQVADGKFKESWQSSNINQAVRTLFEKFQAQQKELDPSGQTLAGAS